MLHLSTELLPTAEELNKYAEKKIESEVVATFELENITHARVGGYNASVSSPDIGFNERIRTTAIKGIWRWWLRAALAGAYCDAGYPTDRNQVRKCGKEILGSTDQQSLFSLKLTEEKIGSPEVFADLGDMPARLKLMIQGVNDEQEKKLRLTVYPPRTLKFQISVLKSKLPKNSSFGNESEKQAAINMVAVGSLSLSLLLGGLGSITRRGFGHFRLNMTFANEGVKPLQDTLSSLYRSYTNVNIEPLRKLVVGAAIQVLGLERKGTFSEKISKVSCLCNRHFHAEIHSIDLTVSRGGNQERLLLAKIGKSVLKNTWKMNDPRNKGKSLKARQFVRGKQYETWILGLPREGKGNITARTGYLVPNKDEFRRPSAIFIAPILKETNGNFRALVFGFKSSDWPDIVHYSYGNLSLDSKRKGGTSSQVFEEGDRAERISRAFDSAFKTICSYLEGKYL